MPANTKWSWRSVLVVALILLLIGPYTYVQLVPDPSDRVSLPPITLRAPAYTVLVADWGYHTSILLPQPAGYALGPVNDAHASYVEFSWGDRSYFMESNEQPHRVFATLFLPTESVVYLAGWPRAPHMGDGMRTLWSRTLTADELARLYAVLEGTMRHDSTGLRLSAYPAQPGYRGRFQAAHGYYLFWSDCNRWTLDQLHIAGLSASGTGVILSRQVSARLTGFHREP